jgi:hypothetical protein
MHYRGRVSGGGKGASSTPARLVSILPPAHYFLFQGARECVRGKGFLLFSVFLFPIHGGRGTFIHGG